MLNFRQCEDKGLKENESSGGDDGKYFFRFRLRMYRFLSYIIFYCSNVNTPQYHNDDSEDTQDSDDEERVSDGDGSSSSSKGCSSEDDESSRGDDNDKDDDDDDDKPAALAGAVVANPIGLRRSDGWRIRYHVNLPELVEGN